MLTDTERRRLQEQGLGELWHGYCDDVTRSGEYRMCLCGFAYILAENHINHTFTHAQDYEDLLKKVVRPNMAKFYTFISRIWVPKRWWPSITEWFLALSIGERCKLVHDFGVEVLGWE